MTTSRDWPLPDSADLHKAAVSDLSVPAFTLGN